MHAGIPPANAPAKIEDLNDQTADEIRRLDQFLDRLINLKLATRDFTLQEILQVASGEIGLANARIAAAKAEGKELDRGKLNVPLLMEAQEIMKIDSWLSINPEGALWYRGLATETGRSGGRTVRRAAREVRREAIRHRPHAAAEPIDHRALRRPRRADRHGNADERTTRDARQRSRSTATS